MQFSADPEYQRECLAWRLSQPNDIIRSLAQDYLIGHRSGDTRDAAYEYLRRWPGSKRSKGLRDALLHEHLTYGH